MLIIQFVELIYSYIIAVSLCQRWMNIKT